MRPPGARGSSLPAAAFTWRSHRWSSFRSSLTRVDFVVAHGIWNLASSTAQFRQAVQEAARLAKPGAILFLFTFSRTTLPQDAAPVKGEDFVFTGFAGTPQCFLTAEQLIAELGSAGFLPDRAVPLTELNRPPSAGRRIAGPPVIYEGTFDYALEPRDRCVRG